MCRARSAARALPPAPPGSLVSLYRRYMAMLNAPRRQGAGGGRMHFLLREDLRNLDAISRELALLTQNGIETEGQLLAHEEALKERMAALDGERRALRNEATRPRGGQEAGTAPESLRGARPSRRCRARIGPRTAPLSRTCSPLRRRRAAPL